jgi:hypothetical protein
MQARPVTVLRLVTADTVDAHIARLAARKTALDDALKGSSKGRGKGKRAAGAEAEEDAEVDSGTLAQLLLTALTDGGGKTK